MRTRTLCVGMCWTNWTIFKSNHKVMNGLLDSCNFDSDQVRNWNLSMFRLPDIQCTCSFFIIKIINFLIVYFIKRHPNSLTFFTLNSLHNHLQRSGQYSPFLTWQQMINILFISLWNWCATIWRGWIVSNNWICLTCTGLTVGENSNVSTSQKLRYALF